MTYERTLCALVLVAAAFMAYVFYDRHVYGKACAAKGGIAVVSGGTNLCILTDALIEVNP